MNYFQQAVEDAKRYRDHLVEPHPQNPYITVTTMMLGPDNVTKVPCGESTFPRCQADEFIKGVLTITSMDDGYEMRIYAPGEWAEAVAYDAFGHLSYLIAASCRP